MLFFLSKLEKKLEQAITVFWLHSFCKKALWFVAPAAFDIAIAVIQVPGTDVPNNLTEMGLMIVVRKAG